MVCVYGIQLFLKPLHGLRIVYQYLVFQFIDQISFGYLIKCRKSELENAEVQYKIDYSRQVFSF